MASPSGLCAPSKAEEAQFSDYRALAEAREQPRHCIEMYRQGLTLYKLRVWCPLHVSVEGIAGSLDALEGQGGDVLVDCAGRKRQE